MLIAARVFYAEGIVISDQDAVSRMARQLAESTGPAGFYLYSVGFGPPSSPRSWGYGKPCRISLPTPGRS